MLLPFVRGSNPTVIGPMRAGADEMRVTLTDPPGLFVDGVLKTVIKSEADGAFPHIVLEMSASGRSWVEVTLGELDLFTIVQAARDSKVEKIRDAIRIPIR